MQPEIVCLQFPDVIADRVRKMDLIHVKPWDLLITHLHDSSRDSHHRAVGRNLFEHDASCADLRIFPNGKGSQDFGSRAYHYIVLKSRVALPLFLSRSTKGDALVQGDIVP
ncbi:hypothetical protein SDC9_159642 [bioreactor metagenome]|uniref:Uncharacterized protein n=1 Tax=bioreactor metagenome TaxID=1076179 RepID=A0A645FFE7_9ZZZZ